MEFTCFRCHEFGHISAECPSRTPIAKAHPPAHPEGAPVEREEQKHCLTCGGKGVHTPTCGEPPSDPAWIRSLLDGYGYNAVLHTPFRAQARIMPRYERDLQQLAIDQAAESRAGRERGAALSSGSTEATTHLEAAAASWNLPVLCGGEIAIDGTLTDHCPPEATGVALQDQERTEGKDDGTG